MKIEAITYTDNQYLIGYDEDVSETEVRQQLSRNYASLEDEEFSITKWEEAEASHTNNAEDLDTLDELANAYDNVAFISLQMNN